MDIGRKLVCRLIILPFPFLPGFVFEIKAFKITLATKKYTYKHIKNKMTTVVVVDAVTYKYTYKHIKTRMTTVIEAKLMKPYRQTNMDKYRVTIHI